MRISSLFIALIAVITPASLFAEDDPYTKAIEYRQAAFKIVGANFSPMTKMIKGEAAWDDAKFAAYAKDLAAVASVDIGRGFIEGSEFGRTKAKEAIWENMDDFKKRLAKFADDTAAFEKTVAGKDKKAIKKSFAQLGKDNCKGCHKKYKSKEYAE